MAVLECAEVAPPTRVSMKTAPSAGLTPYIPFDRLSGVPFYTQIYDGYRVAILSGRLGPGQRLPSTRTLAAELQISRLPVLNAFEQLLHEGYLEGKVGSGTYVRDCIPDEVARPMRLRHPPLPVRKRPFVVNPSPARSRRDDGSGVFKSLPALDRFPNETFARLTRRHAGRLSEDLLAYADPGGYAPLRDAIAAYLRTARAVDCDPDQVIVVSGSQMGLRLAAMTLATPDSIACMEDPGYRGARSALAGSAATIAPIAVDHDGIDVAAITRLGERARFVYVTPSHQYPLGVSLGVSRRLELLGWAERNESWILEDDYDSEFRYSSRTLGALQGMDTGDRVIYLGTFSKVLFPALRLGYVVVPHELIPGFIRMREALDLFSPLLYQLVLTDFLKEGHFARHLRRMRAIYLARRNALIAAIREHAGDVLTIENTDAGLHLVTFIPEDVDDLEVASRAAECGLFPAPLSACYAAAPSRAGLILGFGGANEQVLSEGVRTLAGLVRDCRPAQSRKWL
jgi:GntR family transcriptional regulator/MocR family aminotransferase